MGSGADYHYRSEADFLRMIEYARDLDRNDAVIGQGVTRAVGNTIQDGIRLDPKTGNEEVDRELLARWEAWGCDARECDAAGEMTWPEIEHLALRQTFVDGDIGFACLNDGRLQAIEGHRIRTPSNGQRNIVHGVELDDLRGRVAYHVVRDEIDPNRAARLNDFQRIAAHDELGRLFLHVYCPTRVSQTRGVSALVPVFDTASMFEDINFATLIKQQVSSSYAVLRELPLTAEGGLDSPTGARESGATYSDGVDKINEGIGPGMTYQGLPGEKLTGFSPNVPNAEFFPHMRLTLNIVAINLGLPVAVLLLDASDTNFSGWRGAMDQARQGFRRNQRWLASRFHANVYRWLVERWIEEDASLATFFEDRGDAIFRHGWTPPNWPYIEPLKDASADLLRVRNGLISPRRLHAERGRDWNAIATETIEDNAFAIRKAREAAQKLNGEIDDGSPVHWRELLTLPSPDGVSVQAAAPADGASETSLAPPANGTQQNA